MANGYLALISLQLAATNLQHHRLDKLQAERDAEQRALLEEANQVSLNAHFAQWRQTPDGRLYDRWQATALDTIETVRNRNTAWKAIQTATHEQALNEVRSNIDHDAEATAKRRARLSGAAAIGLFVLAMIFVALGGAVLENIGAFFGLLAFLAIIPTVKFSKGIGRARDQAESRVQQQAQATLAARYGAPNASWHPEMTLDRIQEITGAIEQTISSAAKNYPAPSQLQSLAPLLATRDISSYPHDLPSEAKQLLELFKQEDVEKRANIDE